MKPIYLSKFRALLGRLSASDLLIVMPEVQQRERDVESDLVVKEAESRVKTCPHCDSEAIVRNGHKDGKQEFKCKACLKRFNAKTGTPMARLRMPEKHIPNANCMIESLSIRQVARKLGINTKTAFRWRHRFLAALKDDQPTRLSGLVEVDETFFRESFKGQRSGMPRPPKVRGTPASKPGLSAEQIPVLVARDRVTGATLSVRIESRSAKHIGAKLIPVLDKDTLLCTDGAKAYKAIGKKTGIVVKSVVGHKKANPYHVNTVNSYHSRLKNWMEPFAGVATKNIPVYLGWHRMLDRDGLNATGKSMVERSLRVHSITGSMPMAA